MNLNNCIGLKKKDIISFVGAGGKTTMMFKLAQELRQGNKVLVTTTTKICYPLGDSYDFISTDTQILPRDINKMKNGIYILGSGVNQENKILGLSSKKLDDLVPYFDYILIEADGAKKKQLKGWNETEPVLYSKTTKTIGIIDIQALGIQVNEDNVHRSEIFCELTGALPGDTVKIKHLLKIVINPLALFKTAYGEKILYINKVEGPSNLISAKVLASQVNLHDSKLTHKILLGSLKTGIYIEKWVI